MKWRNSNKEVNILPLVGRIEGPNDTSIHLVYLTRELFTIIYKELENT